jgi:hypothetical protein
MSLRLAWATQQVPEQPRLHSETLYQEKQMGWEQWLMPVIPVNWQAEVGRIVL